jgi:hypothetical protein
VTATTDGELASILLGHFYNGRDLGRVRRSEEAGWLDVLNLSGPVRVGGSIGIGSVVWEKSRKLCALCGPVSL